MSHQNYGIRSLIAFVSVPLAAMLVAGCSGSNTASTTTTTTNAVTGNAFVIGTDAPVAGVISFTTQIQSVNAIDSSGNSVSLVSGTPTVDFARYNGLQTLLDLNAVPVGTYNSVQITLGTTTIGYLNTQAGAAPTVQTEPATLSTSTIKVTLPTPLIVSQTGPVGLRVDFDLYKSIQVDSTGQITGNVTPTFNVTAVAPSDSGGHIDDFDAAVVSVNASGQSFVIQGPHGRQFTVQVNGQTEFDNSESLSDLTTSSIVEVSGTIATADSTITADEVAILSQDGFHAGGQVTYVQPPSGTATSFDLYVRDLLPTTTGLSLGQIATVNLTGNEKYFIYWMHNPLTQFLFNSKALLPGQHVSIGGPASGATNAQAVTAKRVVLRNWGFNGTVVAGSMNSGNDTFQMNINGFAGLLVPGPVTVYLGTATDFRDGLTSMTSLTAGSNIRVVGLLVKDPLSGNSVLLARHVDQLN
ncbi:uncharacterized protein DUF4382 [Edaphobacter aggregans]|uniref:Uncharacterized protein DUF4382 n=1 Tax=Edaphobacter aggregans TaxID=570835 RepID=A0A428MK10_9BACT|nr:DUF4382 domain-containing protein [Edaphobacter aggregans]RSL17265.1 uncharacterized protein DUF4382 [Edaphobacter aggregans]